MHEPLLGQGVKPEKGREWLEKAVRGLVDQEVVLAVFSVAQLRPMSEAAFVTNARVVLATAADGGFRFTEEHRLDRLSDVVVRTRRLNPDNQVLLTAVDGETRVVTLAGRHGTEDARALVAAVAQARQHPDSAQATASLPAFHPSAAPERQATRSELREAEREAKRAELRAELARRKGVKEPAALPPEVVTIGDRVTGKALKAIQDHANPGEQPWLVISSTGAGVLAAFDDRVVIIKTGALTSLTAGSWGGGRSATFHLTDITGIEYNAGFANGVLEILTPSYDGTTAKDYWRGSLSSRNADALDPHTLSNTLPLTRRHHAAAQPHLNQLRSRISAAKRPAATPAAPAAPAAPARSLAGEILELAALHEAGVLTEEEFATAKAKLLGS